MRITSWARKVKKPSKKVGILSIGVLAGLMVGGGSAYAAAQITSGDIANQTIQSWDVHRGGVKSSEVANQSLHSWDLARNSVGASEITNRSIGQSDLSSNVQSKLNTTVKVHNLTVTVGAGEIATKELTCENGTALGGGVTAPDSTRGDHPLSALTVNESGPVAKADASGWHTTVTNTGDADSAYLAWVTCATAG